MKVKVTCVCCETEHVITQKELGKALLKLRKKPNSPEHMKRISLLGVEARRNKKGK